MTSTVSRATASRADRWRMPPRARKANLVLHVIVSVSWLGLDIGLLTLTITALTTDDTMTVRAAYVAMRLFGDILLIPVALLTLATGVVLCLGTHWGITRHWWVLGKLVLTLTAGTLTIFSLRPGLHEAARAALATPADHGSAQYLIPPLVSLTMYVTMTLLSIYKPWGRTPWARPGKRSTVSGSGRSAVRPPS